MPVEPIGAGGTRRRAASARSPTPRDARQTRTIRGRWSNCRRDRRAPSPGSVFDPKLLLAPDPRHSQQEPRFHALGETSVGRTLHLTFTLREEGTRIRLISARDMHRKERAIYEGQD